MGGMWRSCSGSPVSGFRYFRAVEHGEETVWESKVLIVGEGAVGKTRLYQALKGEPWVEGAPDSGATVGIEIGPLPLPHPAHPDVTMHLKCWDFAGQDVTHATHQFFFSERTLFLVCWNARAGWEAGKLRKWLANIRDRAPHATVLLVATQCDEPHSDYPEKELRADFPQIAATFKTSSKRGDGIPELRAAIAEHAQALPMMGLRWPQSWRAAQQAVQSLGWDEPHAGLPKVQQVLLKRGLKEEDAELLLRWLHELGEVLYYHDDPDLAYVVMLDPQWVTKRVGEVLASRAVQDAQGVLTRACLDELWPEAEPHIREHLLRMMERFDLAYRVPERQDDRSLVVERLPQNPPSYEADWEAWAGQPQVRLRYRLKAMHPGIPTWFIARCHRFSCGIHWLRGVLFQDHAKDARHLALIMANETDRTVDFTVRGAQPWTFLPLLKDGFEDTVTKRYPGLEWERLAPCPGTRKDGTACDYEFALADLEALRWPLDPAEEPIFNIRCTRCRTEHRIDALLLGLSPAPAKDAEKLEEILLAVHDEGAATREHVTEEMKEARQFIQRAFVDEWNKAQEIEEQSCPTVFALFPVDGATIMRESTMRLQLYCMAPGCWHGIGAEGACQFQPMKEGWATAARWTHRAVKWLRPTAALLPGGLALAGEYAEALKDTADAAKNELALTASVFKELDAIPALSDASEARLAQGALAREHQGDVELRELKMFLDSLDFPVKPCGGLRRVRTPEGHLLWLCAEHAAEFAR